MKKNREQIKSIKKLITEGQKPKKIADTLRVPYTTVYYYYWQMTRNKGDGNPPVKQASKEKVWVKAKELPVDEVMETKPTKLGAYLNDYLDRQAETERARVKLGEVWEELEQAIERYIIAEVDVRAGDIKADNKALRDELDKAQAIVAEAKKSNLVTNLSRHFGTLPPRKYESD